MKVWSFLIAIFFIGAIRAEDCVSRDYGSDSVVCVCNATYCDVPTPYSDEDVSEGAYVYYQTTRAGDRLKKTTREFDTSKAAAAADVSFNVDRSTTYQEMMGFGGALTDSTALNIKSLSEALQEVLLKSYFGEGGSQYSFLRVPMGACDFSLDYYTYDEVEGDESLEHFALIDNDVEYKVPIIKRAGELRGQDIKLFTAPWTGPTWMKDSGKYMEGHLLEKYYQVFANYFVKYFDAFAQLGVKFWGLAPQNEPTHPISNIPVMGYSAEQERDWVKNYLGPTLEKAGYGDLKMMALDDNRNNLPAYADGVLSDGDAAKYFSGVGVHWYTEDVTPDVLTETHDHFPDKFLFYTESCNLVRVVREDYGDWSIAEKYANSMFQAFNHWVSAWTDWNLALNEEGGPATFNAVPGNFGYNAAILVNATADEFYKQPPYYFQAHFSMFVPQGSKRIELSTDNDGGLLNVAFVTPDDEIVVVLNNQQEEDVTVNIGDPDRGSSSVLLPSKSITTLLYK